ncbi:antiterminator Q family protein [Xenorhabdus griffiniae]|uniref:antiterminator Q family protein n=1 Tax=Xenorhabdus griffiniae TaxID=351672 RepID=UPI0030CF1ECB
MHRDIPKILTYWGEWVVQGRVNIGWKSISVGFKNAVTYSGNNKLSCSDEDGMIIDGCVAKLRNVDIGSGVRFLSSTTTLVACLKSHRL